MNRGFRNELSFKNETVCGNELEMNAGNEPNKSCRNEP